MIETINEPIEVITVFAEGKVSPVRFKWKDRVVKIRKVTGSWSMRKGWDKLYYYSVLAENSDYYELCYDTSNMTWIICRLWLEG